MNKNNPIIETLDELSSSLEDTFIEHSLIRTAQKMVELGITRGLVKARNVATEPPIIIYQDPALIGGGGDLFSHSPAFGRALGETLERRLWFHSDVFYKYRGIRAPYHQLKNRALNIFSIAGFSEEQRKQYADLLFNDRTPFHWTLGHSLTQEKSLFCPTQLISAHYMNRRVSEPLLRWGITTGLATANTLDEAITKGALEVIERDAFMVAYLNRLSPPILDLPFLAKQDKRFDKIHEYSLRYKLNIRLLLLPTDFPVHVCCALITDTSNQGPRITIGASAHYNVKDAALKALTEAMSSRHRLRSDHYRDLGQQKLSPEKLDRDQRMVYWGQKSDTEDIKFFEKGKHVHIDLEKSKTQQNFQETLGAIVSQCKKKRYELMYVELTTASMKRKLGLNCAFVVMPELQPLHLNEQIPYLTGNRLRSVPLETGYQPAVTVNIEPHPFP